MQLTKVTRNPGSPPRPRSMPAIVVIGRFFPTDRVEWLELRTAKGSLTRQLMQENSHRFRSIGGLGDQRLAVVDGIEVFTHPAALCDPQAAVNHARQTQRLSERLTPEQVERLRTVLEDLPSVNGAEESGGLDLPRIESVVSRLRELSRQNPALERVVQTAAKPVQVVRAAERLNTILFVDADSDSLQVRA